MRSQFSLKGRLGEDSDSQWLSLGPAAHLLGVSEVTLRHWADAGRVRSYRTVGSHRRFSREDLQALLKDREQPARPEDMEDQALQRLRRRLRVVCEVRIVHRIARVRSWIPSLR